MTDQAQMREQAPETDPNRRVVTVGLVATLREHVITHLPGRAR